MYARWAHRVLWHEFEPGWAIHKSHHEARIGPFEANDIFAVMNALPAIVLTAYGFFTPSEWGGMCFGLGMGITVFGIAYMFVHDGALPCKFLRSKNHSQNPPCMLCHCTCWIEQVVVRCVIELDRSVVNLLVSPLVSLYCLGCYVPGFACK